MSLRQIEVTKCNDCPFKSGEDDYNNPKCNGVSRFTFNDIYDVDNTPDWCPLMKDDFIQVSHIKNCT